jgi:hypothetical protein
MIEDPAASGLLEKLEDICELDLDLSHLLDMAKDEKERLFSCKARPIKLRSIALTPGEAAIFVSPPPPQQIAGELEDVADASDYSETKVRWIPQQMRHRASLEFMPFKVRCHETER